MATVKAEKFDVEAFGKMVALFDSNNAGEAENAFRKAVLICAKNGLRFADAAGMAFGHDDGGEVAELRDQLQRQEAEYAGKLTWSAEEIQRLNGELAAALSDRAEGERSHDFKGWLRRMWVFPQFRLALMAAVHVTGIAVVQILPVGPLFLLADLCLFVAWSIAQGRKEGLGQMLMKWVVYFSASAICIMVFFLAFQVHGNDRLTMFACLVAAQVVAVVLTLSRLSEWLCERVRVNVWESNPVHVVRGWF